MLTVALITVAVAVAMGAAVARYLRRRPRGLDRELRQLVRQDRRTRPDEGTTP